MAVRCLEHVNVEQGDIFRRVARAETVDAGGVNGDEAMKRIDFAKITHDLGPAFDLRAVVVGKPLCEIIGQVCLAGGTPHDRQGAVTRDEVAPVLFHFLHSHPRDEITPRADDARRETLIDEVSKPSIGGIEIFGSDAAVVGLPGVTGFVGAARVERRHVRIKAGNDLNDVKALFFPVSRKLFEFVRPMQPMAKPHPPGVPQPEERRSVRVFQVAAVG